ncbi:hypothetical protein J1614_009486 [Plenodomus biglobosus]|nr:hypothetical protein J1614_009486 [Plenodomus biglobosus]
MRLYVSTAISILLSPLASAACYKKGPSNVNVQVAFDQMDTTASFLQGELVGGQERGLCVTDLATGTHWYMSVRNEDSGKGRLVTKADIDTYLRREINGCGTKGGHRGESGVEYTYVYVSWIFLGIR